MPKIINEAYNSILTSAKKIMFEEGYSHFSIRNVADECGIAVGTIYNYFENKDTLVATILFEDWKLVLDEMEIHCKNAVSLEDGCLAIYHGIQQFCSLYENLWDQFSGNSSSVKSRHHFQQEQLSNKVNLLFMKFHLEEDLDLSTILAECILTCATQNAIQEKEFKKFINRLFK